MLPEIPKDYLDDVDIDEPDDAEMTYYEFLDLMTPIWLLQLDQLKKGGWLNNNASRNRDNTMSGRRNRLEIPSERIGGGL